MKKVDKIFKLFENEITGMYRIVVDYMDKSVERRTFMFQPDKLNKLEKSLLDRYGKRAVNGIMKEINKSIENDTLKDFAKDNSLDFKIKGDTLEVLIPSKITEEISAEYTGGVDTIKLYGGDKTWIGSISLNNLLARKFDSFAYNPKLPQNSEKPLPVHLDEIRKILSKNKEGFDGTDGHMDFVFSAGKIIKMKED